MHVGLVGAGRIGAFHARVLAASPAVDRLKIADLDTDLAARVAGELTDGAVLHDQRFARHGDVDTAAAVLRLADGPLGIVSGTRHDPRGYDVRMGLFCSADSVSVGLDRRTPLRLVEPGVQAPMSLGYRNFLERFDAAYRTELAAFLEVARGRTESPCTGDDARRALLIAMTADRSLAEHRPVRLEEVA
jgi:myo-inositol 2-dehydrogenase/D-chiro-inositol 1-dehydrogenase